MLFFSLLFLSPAWPSPPLLPLAPLVLYLLLTRGVAGARSPDKYLPFLASIASTPLEFSPIT